MMEANIVTSALLTLFLPLLFFLREESNPNFFFFLKRFTLRKKKSEKCNDYFIIFSELYIGPWTAFRNLVEVSLRNKFALLR